MPHPLLAFAAAYDHLLSPLFKRPSLKVYMELWLENLLPGDAISYYAAYFSVLTQTYQLGDYGILEEPQTDALYGLLASSFWHAMVLDNAYRAYDTEAPRRCYWLHQRKPQEAKSGFDFGIITSCDDGRVKVTLFQAKRPAKENNPLKLCPDHIVRANKMKLHTDIEALNQSLEEVDKQLDKAAKGSDEQKTLQEKKKWLEKENDNWDHYAPARAQLEAITVICAVLEEGGTADNALEVINDCVEFSENITRMDEGSLFNSPHSYRQSQVFLVTAIRGWQMENARTLPNGWCHYAQWVNRSEGEPWSVRLESAIALLNNKEIDHCRRSFAEVLGASLSSTDETVGLIIDEGDLGRLTGAIMRYLPGLVWGAVAEQPGIARDLLRQCGVPEKEIAPDFSQPYPRPMARVQRFDNDLGNDTANTYPIGRS